jgi:hypothetical protein
MSVAVKVILFVFVTIVGVFAVIAAVYAIRSLFMAKAAEKYLDQATRLLREHRETEALALYLKAESRWALNSYDGGRESLLHDLEQYMAIAAGIFKILGKHAGSIRSDVHGMIAEMKAHLRERSNFGIDGRKMKADAAERWEAMCSRLSVFREKLRESCRMDVYH